MEGFVGEIVLLPFVPDYIPDGWVLCDGRILSIRDYQALFSLISYRFGGNGVDTFALPNLKDARPNNRTSYYISTGGIFPAISMDLFIGEIRLFPYLSVPYGFKLCNGDTLNINQNQHLFAVLGVRYGGNGITNFKLPNLLGTEPCPGTSYYIETEGIFPRSLA